MSNQDEMVEAIKLLLDCIEDAQQAAQRNSGNNWDIRRALLECAHSAIAAKRYATIAAGRSHAAH